MYKRRETRRVFIPASTPLFALVLCTVLLVETDSARLFEACLVKSFFFLMTLLPPLPPLTPSTLGPFTLQTSLRSNMERVEREHLRPD